jgi:light-regulated signal transduction histidine kinase (bacteriophytochrome)
MWGSRAYPRSVMEATMRSAHSSRRRGRRCSAFTFCRRSRDVFRVVEEGPGGLAAEQEHIFEAFARSSSVDRTRRSRLAIPIARGFVHLDRGDVCVLLRPGN